MVSFALPLWAARLRMLLSFHTCCCPQAASLGRPTTSTHSRRTNPPATPAAPLVPAAVPGPTRSSSARCSPPSSGATPLARPRPRRRPRRHPRRNSKPPHRHQRSQPPVAQGPAAAAAAAGAVRRGAGAQRVAGCFCEVHWRGARGQCEAAQAVGPCVCGRSTVLCHVRTTCGTEPGPDDGGGTPEVLLDPPEARCVARPTFGPAGGWRALTTGPLPPRRRCGHCRRWRNQMQYQWKRRMWR